MKPGWISSMAMSLVLLSSCGPSEKAKDEPTPAPASPEQIRQAQQEADKIIKEQMAKVQQREASTFPCSLFTQQEIEALAGNPLDKGSYALNHVSEDDHNYRSQSCDWSAKTTEGNEVGVWVSLPKHFDSDKVECSPGSASASKIPGLGDQAWWEYQKSYGMGTLRVCSAKAMLEAKITMKSKEEAPARTIAQTIAEKVLASQPPEH